MKASATSLSVLFLLVALAAIQFAHFYPKLPDQIAVHFSAGGEADSWDSKGSFVVIYAAIEAFLVLMALGSAFAIERIPASLVNIPNRDFWFTGEQREGTLTYLATQLVWFEAASLAFLIAVAQMIFTTNLREGPPTLPLDFPVVLAIFIGGIAWMSLRLYLRFRRLPD
jgi:uncharacterized membrane protein